MAEAGLRAIELREKFQDFSSKFSVYAKENSKRKTDNLDGLVEELLLFTDNVPTEAVIYPDYDIILTSMGILVTSHQLDLIKVCEFVSKLIVQHNVVLRKELIDKVLSLCFHHLTVSNFSSDSFQVLKAMENLLKADHDHALEINHLLLRLASPANGILIQIMSSRDVNGQLLLSAVKCLELVLLPPCLSSLPELTEKQQSGADEVSEACMQALLIVLGRGKLDDLDDLEYCKLVIAALRSMHHLLFPSVRSPLPYSRLLLISGYLSEILGVVRAFLAVDLPGASDAVKYPVGPFKADADVDLAIPAACLELDEKKDSYKGRTTKALRKNRKKMSKNRVDILVDSPSEEMQDRNQRTVQPDPDLPQLPHCNLTSDSDLSSSDVESGKKKDTKGRSAFSKVRQMACSLLLAVIKVTDPKTLFSFWQTLLPDGTPTCLQYHLPSTLKIGEPVTIATVMLRDPSSEGRALAAKVLASLLTSWQRFLSEAECSKSKKAMAFTPFSLALGWSLCSLHRHLCLAFASEVSPNSLLQLLRCSTALVLASSYHKLTPGLLNRLVGAVRPLLKRRDKSLQVSIMTLFGAVVSLDPTPPEVIQIFNRTSTSNVFEKMDVINVQGVKDSSSSSVAEKNPSDEEDTWDNEYYEEEDDQSPVNAESQNVSDITSNIQDPQPATNCLETKSALSIPWIVEVCLEPLTIQEGPGLIPFQIECLQVLSSIARNQDLAPKLLLHPNLWNILQTRFVIGPGAATEVGEGFFLKYHWGKFWESLGLVIRRFLDLEGEEVLTLSQAVNYWQSLLSGTSLIPLIQDMDTPSLRVVGCDVLASIGATVFAQLTRDKQILCETLLFGSSRDEEPSVKSAALRALGVYSLYPSLREDIHFLLDASDALQSAIEGDPSRGEVWDKAVWSLGNLTDAFLLNKEEGLTDSIPDGPLLDILEICATSCQPLPKGSFRERVRCNAVRAAGNIISLVDFNGWDEMAGSMSLFYLGKRGKDAALKIAHALVESAGKSSDMKVRWNACYAISTMLKNRSLYVNKVAFDDLVTKPAVFSILCSLVRDFRNLKVRISAALALSSPLLHSDYGQKIFVESWRALLEGLDNSQRSVLFTAGHNHLNNLFDQIVLTLCHLAKLVERSDLLLFGELLDPYLENAQGHMISRSQTLVPEKASVIAEAASHLASLRKRETNLTKIEEESLSKLLKIFTVENNKDFNPFHRTLERVAAM